MYVPTLSKYEKLKTWDQPAEYSLAKNGPVYVASSNHLALDSNAFESQ